jgi:tRNA uridine 5-carboxymethylaminomethyl modification enzyme
VFTPEEINPILASKKSASVKQKDKMFKLYARPSITIKDMLKVRAVHDYVESKNLDTEVIEQTEIQVKYAGYIEKEKTMQISLID